MAWTHFPVQANTLIVRAPFAELREKINDLREALGLTILNAPSTSAKLLTPTDLYRANVEQIIDAAWFYDSETDTCAQKTKATVLNTVLGQSDWTPAGLIRVVHINEVQQVVQWLATNMWARKTVGVSLYSDWGLPVSWNGQIDENTWSAARVDSAAKAATWWAGSKEPGEGFYAGTVHVAIPLWHPSGRWHNVDGAYPDLAWNCRGTIDSSAWPACFKASDCKYRTRWLPPSGPFGYGSWDFWDEVFTGYWVTFHMDCGLIPLRIKLNNQDGGYIGSGHIMRECTGEIYYDDFDFVTDDNDLAVDESGMSFFVPPDSSFPGWQSGQTYYVGDSVSSDGRKYICIQQHVSSSSNDPEAGGNAWWDEVDDYGWEGEPEDFGGKTAYWWGTPIFDALMIKPYFSWAA